MADPVGVSADTQTSIDAMKQSAFDMGKISVAAGESNTSIAASTADAQSKKKVSDGITSQSR